MIDDDTGSQSAPDSSGDISDDEPSDERGKLWSVVLIIGFIILMAWFQIASSADDEQSQPRNAENQAELDLRQSRAEYCNLLYPLDDVLREICLAG